MKQHIQTLENCHKLMLRILISNDQTKEFKFILKKETSGTFYITDNVLNKTQHGKFEIIHQKDEGNFYIDMWFDSDPKILRTRQVLNENFINVVFECLEVYVIPAF